MREKDRSGRKGMTGGSTKALAAEGHAEETAMHRQRAAACAIDKAQLPELVHEMTDPRPGGADPFGVYS